MRFLIRVLPSGIPPDRLLEAVKTVAKTLGSDPRNQKWTSYGALELDIFSPSKSDFDLFVTAVKPLAKLEFIRDLNVPPPYREEAELLAEARQLFNEERYWECHEVLEGIWRTKQGAEKNLLQGIILVCAAFVHHQKGEERVALGVMERAVRQLEYPAALYGGFSVQRFKADSEDILKYRRFAVFRV